MAEDERETPSIAPPSLSFGRRRRRSGDAPTSETTSAVPPEPATQTEETAVLPTASASAPAATPDWDPAWGPAPAVPGERRGRAEKAPRAPKAPKAAKAPKAPRAAKAPKPERTPRPPRRRPQLPAVPTTTAVVVGGLIVGALMVGLTAGALRSCEAVRGAATCGGGPGTLLLLAIVAVAIWAGGHLLRLLRVPDAGGTSFLGVALLCVIALLFLIDELDQWWMAIVIPLLAAGSFWAAHAISSAVVDEE